MSPKRNSYPVRTIYARIDRRLANAFLVRAVRDKRSVVAQLEVILEDWLTAHGDLPRAEEEQK